MANVGHTFWRQTRTLTVRGVDNGLLMKLNSFGGDANSPKGIVTVALNSIEAMQLARAVRVGTPMPSKDAPNKDCTLIHTRKDDTSDKSFIAFGVNSNQGFTFFVKRQQKNLSISLNRFEADLLALLCEAQVKHVAEVESVIEDKRFQEYKKNLAQTNTLPAGSDDTGVPGEDGGGGTGDESDPASGADDIPF